NYNNIAEPPTSMRPELVRLIEEGGSVSGATVPAPGLSFRGTNNTYSQDHSSTREIIPCFLTYQGSIFAGRPGRNDRMRFLLPQNITTGGLAAFSTINWTSAYSGHEVWVATKEVLPGAVINIEPTRFPETTASVGQFEDSREFTRIAKVPSGELPIEATSVAVGGRYDGPGDEIAGTIDEIEFTSPVILTNRDAIGKLIVNQSFNASATGFTVSPIVPSNPYSAATNPVLDAAALPGFSKSISGRVLSLMPADAGIVMIGEELIGYDNFDAASGQFTVAKNGRGMLGTKATGHGAFETVVFLDHFVVTQLASAATPGSSRLAGEDMQGFPSEGTILIGSELSHYTRIESQSFAMPEFEDDNAVPGESSAGIAIQMKRKGYGIFRGRYGSIPENHAAGEIIFKFPYRYWDRWVAGSDEPELNYIQMDECKDSGFYRRVSWIEELPLPGVTFEAIARLDARSPWTAEANNSDGLWMFTRPQSGEKSNWILRQGSRLEMRLGVRFGLGSFSPIQPPIENATVRNDAWKTTPRLRAIATERFGATKVLWREEHR
ncbi:MAG: hypothetical protein ACKVS6_14790, partial [Planctomycetota bacterium]